MNWLLILIAILIVLGILTYIYYILDKIITIGEYGFDIGYYIQLGYNEVKTIVYQILNTPVFIFGKKQKNLVESDYYHQYYYRDKPRKERQVFPFIASAVIRNKSGELLFVGGTEGQSDGLLRYSPEDNKLVNIIANTGLNNTKYATLAAAVSDMNNNGLGDLVVARTNGVFIYLNKGDGTFSKHQIYGPFTDSSPSAISISDFNKNGLLDIYISRFTHSTKLNPFQFNNPDHPRYNILLENIGNLKFEDVTKKMNAAGNQNTFTSIFIDFGSGWPDLVLAHDTGRIEILRNIQGKRFESIIPEKTFGFWMGIGVGDYNNSGQFDLFFTNVGDTMPLTKTGGIRGSPEKGGLHKDQILTNKHMLLRNDGNYKFTDVSNEVDVGGGGFGWGAIMEDINLDGYVDIIFAQNYLYYSHQVLLPGAVLINQKGKKFKRIYKYTNKNYAHTPVMMDINGNGIKDIVWANIIGPVFGYLNENKDKNNWINIKLPENAQYANATVRLFIGQQQQIRQQIYGGVGFGGDQSHLLSFGLGQNKKVDKIIIETIGGDKITIEDPTINKTIVINREGKRKLN